MTSIWQKTFGKFNKKKNMVRELSEELIRFKKDYDYDAIADAVITIGGAYKFANEMDLKVQVYESWKKAKELNVLDEAVKRAIEQQDNDSEDSDDNTAEKAALTSMTTTVNNAAHTSL